MLERLSKFFAVASVHYVHPEVTETAAERIMDALMDNDFDNVFDPDITAHLSEGRVDVCLGITARSQPEAALVLDATLRRLRELGAPLPARTDYDMQSTHLVDA